MMYGMYNSRITCTLLVMHMHVLLTYVPRISATSRSITYLEGQVFCN